MTLPLTDNLRALVAAVEAADVLSASVARRLLQESGITAEELAPWADVDHPAADGYGRKMIHDGGHFELMVMSWRDGSMSAIHDHGHTTWGAVRLYGDAEHATFCLRDNTLTTRSRRTFASGSVIPVVNDLIHQMGNVGQAPYLTLHLYGCEECTGGITHDARIFDLDEQAIQFTNGGVFFALPEDAVTRRQSGLRGDFPTTLRHNVEVLYRQAQAGGGSRMGRLVSWLCAPQTWQAAGFERDSGDADYRARYRQEVAAALRIVDTMAARALIPADTAARLRNALPLFIENF